MISRYHTFLLLLGVAALGAIGTIEWGGTGSRTYAQADARPVRELLQLPMSSDSQARLVASAPIIAIATLYAIAEAPGGGRQIEGGGHCFTQTSFYRLIEPIRGRPASVFPVTQRITERGYMGVSGGLDREEFELGRKFILFVYEERDSAERGRSKFQATTECWACQLAMISGYLREEDGSLLRYRPIGLDSGIYAFSEAGANAVKVEVSRLSVPKK